MYEDGLVKLNDSQAENEALKKKVEEYRKIIHAYKDCIDGAKKDFWENTEKMNIQVQKAQREPKEKDRDLKMVIAQAHQVAQQVADVADMAMALSQNMDPAFDHGGKMSKLFEEIRKLGSKAHQYL